ncbi:hypothetical protein AB0D08_10440 [Kitasatospora sp. NPDC048540]
MSDRTGSPDGPVDEVLGAAAGDADTGLLDDGAYDDVITRSVN